MSRGPLEKCKDSFQHKRKKIFSKFHTKSKEGQIKNWQKSFSWLIKIDAWEHEKQCLVIYQDKKKKRRHRSIWKLWFFTREESLVINLCCCLNALVLFCLCKQSKTWWDQHKAEKIILEIQNPYHMGKLLSR